MSEAEAWREQLTGGLARGFRDEDGGKKNAIQGRVTRFCR